MMNGSSSSSVTFNVTPIDDFLFQTTTSAGTDSDTNDFSAFLQGLRGSSLNPSNIDKSLKYINQSLAAYGFIKEPLELASSDPNQILRIVNCLYLMLQQRQRDVDLRDEMQDRARRLQCDKENLSENLRRLKKELDEEKRNVSALQIKLKSEQQEHKRQRDKLQMDLDQLNKACNRLIGLEAQYQHEIKRKEAELEKMKERLQRTNDARAPQTVTTPRPSGSTDPNMGMINVLPRESGSRGTWKAGQKRNEDKLYQNIVGAFEDQKKELLQENESLRSALKSIDAELHELRTLVASIRGQEDVNMSADSMDASLHSGQFDMPFDLVKEEVENNLLFRIRGLSKQVREMHDEEEPSSPPPPPHD